MAVIATLFLARLNGQRDEDVYEALGFGSDDAMRKQLGIWGLPEDLVGEKPEGETAEIESEAKAPAKERRVRGGGQEPVKLPAAGRALDLFEELVDQLSAELLQLKARTEYLEDGRFVAGSGWMLFRSITREKATEGDAEVIEIVGADSDDAQDDRQSWVEMRVYGAGDFGELETTGWQPEVLGGSAAPPEALVTSAP